MTVITKPLSEKKADKIPLVLPINAEVSQVAEIRGRILEFCILLV